ncbi:GNAT family N-acetyltransferase [Streptomyces sp. LN590]|uniref:GNAT family N-acetyltransferase n=1 Tax=unclassified Streptomyces TaxID=2593676 RepID=UPI00371642E6
MLKGSKVGLGARHEDDIPVLRAELYDDVVNGSRAEGRPWRPITPGSKDSRLVVDDKEQGLVPFSVVELDGGTLVGTATLWGIDNHNRSAHIGLGLLPSSRGKGYGTDVVAVLCHYGFVVRGLQRLQIARGALRRYRAWLSCADGCGHWWHRLSSAGWGAGKNAVTAANGSDLAGRHPCG